MVTPGYFIGIAEDTGLIHPIGEWVLQTACAQNKAWQNAGLPPVRIAVNLSPYQFKQPDLVEKIEQILEQTGLSPHWLELEITESVAMYDVEKTISTLQRLHTLGIHISIDDFGIGYSSLNYLKQFPINKLKIDQSFIRDIATNQDNKAIVRAIIFLALNLRLGVIAEGVETEEQLLFLQHVSVRKCRATCSANQCRQSWLHSSFQSKSRVVLISLGQPYFY